MSNRCMLLGAMLLAALPGCYLSHGFSDTEDADVVSETDAELEDAPVFVSDAAAAEDRSLADIPLLDARDAGSVDSGCDLRPELCGIAATLDGLRWELPCQGPTMWPEVCDTASRIDDATVFAPEFAGRSFDVTVRIRGVVETKEYTGGTTRGHFHFGGTPDTTNWNTYELITTSPSATYYLNAGARESYVCEAVDFTETLRIDGASRVLLSARVFDARQIRNRDADDNAIIIADVPPSPAAFDGQFLQMDVVTITER